MNKRTRHVVGLDLDGVLVDHTENRMKFARAFGVKLAPWETPSEVMRKKIDGPTYGKIQWLLYDNPATALTPPLVSGAREGLLYLHENRTPYFLISRRGYPDRAVELLMKHDLWPHYFGPHNAFFVAQKEDKDEKASALGIQAYLDDEASVLEALSSVPQKFLFDPHRAHHEAQGDFERVFSWPQFIEVLRETG